MDHKKAVTEAFTDLAPRYEKVMDAELQRFWGWSYREFINQLLALTTIQPDDLVLDIATGTAAIPLRLAQSCTDGQKIVGLDITPRMLREARKKIEAIQAENQIRLTCASAMSMPFVAETFSVITCGLAPHHMDVSQFILELQRILKQNGHVTISDVGAAPSWKYLPVRLLLRIFAFCYYLPIEGFARAWAEASAISNILTAEEWSAKLADAGFTNIETRKLATKYPWIPSPIALRATKYSHGGMEKNDNSD